MTMTAVCLQRFERVHLRRIGVGVQGKSGRQVHAEDGRKVEFLDWLRHWLSPKLQMDEDLQSWTVEFTTWRLNDVTRAFSIQMCVIRSDITCFCRHTGATTALLAVRFVQLQVRRGDEIEIDSVGNPELHVCFRPPRHGHASWSASPPPWTYLLQIPARKTAKIRQVWLLWSNKFGE